MSEDWASSRQLGVAASIQESGGPTDLAIGSVSDGEYLKRSGSSVVGAACAVPTQLAFGATTVTLASSIASGAILSEASSEIVGTAGGVQGSVLAWHAASTAFLDSARAWDLKNASTTGLVLRNTTAADAVNTTQYSPAIQLGGTHWWSAASHTDDWRMEVQPYAGTNSSTLVFKRSSDGGAYSNMMTVAPSGNLSMTNNVQVGSGGYLGLYGSVNRLTGLGAGMTALAFGANEPCIFTHESRTDAASAVVFASVYNRNAASITNAATMRIHSFGWTNNSDAYTELGAVFADGAVEGVGVRASGDLAGKASTTGLTNVSLGAGANGPTFINVPGTGAAGQVGWIKITVDTTAYAVPYWAAA